MKGGLENILKLVHRFLLLLIRAVDDRDMEEEEEEEEEDDDDENALPADVKEGHFAVYTVDGGSLRRSIVEVSYLTRPAFLKLLELAEEEFGFKQMGILVIPCTYDQLQSVIARA